MTEKAEEGRHILAELQQSIVVCLQKGPEAFPEGVFAQKRERALLGLRTHANTIAYGRVKAVEDTYPLLLKAIGREAFHPLAQDYVERPDMLHANMNNIGNGFPFYLAQHLARWRAASRSADISAGEEASDRLDINDKRPNAPARAGKVLYKMILLLMIYVPIIYIMPFWIIV